LRIIKYILIFRVSITVFVLLYGQELFDKTEVIFYYCVPTGGKNGTEAGGVSGEGPGLVQVNDSANLLEIITVKSANCVIIYVWVRWLLVLSRRPLML